MPNKTTDTITVTKKDVTEDKGRFSTPKNKKGYQYDYLYLSMKPASSCRRLYASVFLNAFMTSAVDCGTASVSGSAPSKNPSRIGVADNS